MSTILCATDFSPTSDRAVNLAATLARRLGDDVLLIHAIPTYRIPAEIAVAAASHAEASLRPAAERALARAAAGIEARGVRCATRVVVGEPAELIAAVGEELRPRTILMGRHARTGAAQLFIGSVAERVVRTAHVPVLVVPEVASDEAFAGQRPLRVVVGIDRSAASEAVLTFVRALRFDVACDLLFVHAYAPADEQERLGLDWEPDAYEPEPEVVALIERELTERIGKIPGKGTVELRVRPAWGARPERLSWEAGTEAADLIIVGTNQRRGPWARSHAVDAIRAAHVPVLAVPAALRPTVPAPAPIRPIRDIAVATDFSDLGNAAVAEAYRLVRARGGTVNLCYVVEDGHAAPDERETALLLERLRSLIPPGAAPHGIVTRTTVLRAKTAADGILQVGERAAADIIVLGSHGRGGVARAVLGSVADQVMRHARRPVLVVRR